MATTTIIPDTLRIAFLDDRKEARETLVNGMSPDVPDGWEFIECPLKAAPGDYTAWVLDNNVVVLCVDQRLNDKADDSDLPVDYKGSDVVTEIRKRIPDLPVFVVTREESDADLQASFGNVEDVVTREVLLERPRDYIKRFVRTGQAYRKRFEEELSELGRLSIAAASGSISGADVKKLLAVQTQLGLAGSQPSAPDDFVNALEGRAKELDTIRKKIEGYLSKPASKAAKKKMPAPGKKAVSPKVAKKKASKKSGVKKRSR